MRKLFPFLVAGLAAASFSVFAADPTDTKADTKADVKADTGTTGANAGAGASADVKTDSKKTRKVKKQHKDKDAASGSSAAPRDTAKEPVPAPTTPAPIDTPKKTD